jgi:hypothetical protein
MPSRHDTGKTARSEKSEIGATKLDQCVRGGKLQRGQQDRCPDAVTVTPLSRGSRTMRTTSSTVRPFPVVIAPARPDALTTVLAAGTVMKMSRTATAAAHATRGERRHVNTLA